MKKLYVTGLILFGTFKINAQEILPQQNIDSIELEIPDAHLSRASCVSEVSGPAGVGNSITNRVWLDASTLNYSNGSFINQWKDKSGNGFSALPSYPTCRPKFIANQLHGFPAVDFDGVNDHLKIANVTGLDNQSITWFIVGNFNNFSHSQAMLHFSHLGSSTHKNLRYTLYYQNANKIFSSMLRTNGAGPISQHTLSNNSQILSTVINPTTVSSFTNGAPTGSFFANDLVSPVSENSFVSLGRRGALNDMYLDGNLSEVIVYNYQLNAIERILVENYLSSKYNLTISNDKYSLESTGHYHNVSGIGMQDGFAVFDAEGGSGVRISDPSSLGNGKFMLWGHNNATTAPTNVGTPTAYNGLGEMMTRVWRCDKTGNPGTVTVSFHLDGIATGASTNFELLIDDDGVFTDAARLTNGFSYDSECNIATWTNVNPAKLYDGAYFTIGNPNGLALMDIPISEMAIISEDDATEEEMSEEELIAEQRSMEIFDDATETVQMKLYPNPTEGSLTIENLIEGASIEIYNSLGQLVYTSSITTGKNQYDFSHLNTGLYVVHLKDINMETINISQLMIAK